MTMKNFSDVIANIMQKVQKHKLSGPVEENKTTETENLGDQPYILDYEISPSNYIDLFKNPKILPSEDWITIETKNFLGTDQSTPYTYSSDDASEN